MDKYSKRTLTLITTFGWLLIIIGIIAALLAPAEFYSYYLFSKGGRFHYDGFGFGSFIFGIISIQIFAYYLIAILFIPLGYGHIKRHKWISKIVLTLLWIWYICGIPLIMILLFMLITFKVPSLFFMIFCIILCISSYTFIPVLLIRFYKSDNVENALSINNGINKFIEKYPTSILINATLLVFYIFVFHSLFFFKGIFPFFGNWLIDFPGFIVITVSILIFVALIIGTLRIKSWAWWVSFIYLCVFSLSLSMTLIPSNVEEIVTLLNLPATESKALINIPLEGLHLFLIAGVPLILSIAAIIYSRKFYGESKITV
jgi:hypothetical protein